MAQVIKKIQVDNETHPIDGAFYLGTLSTVAGSAASGSYKSVRWYVSDCEGVTAPYDGMRIAIKIPLAGVGTAGAILSINGNNDADYHPLAYNVNTVLTTHFPVNSIKVFVYDASATMTCYKTANTSVSVTGVWKADSNYDSNTVITYGTMEYYFRPYNGANALYRYKFVALDKDNRVVPLTTTNVANGTAVTNITPTNVAFRPDKIWWYSTTTTIAASGLLGAQTLWRSGYNANNTSNGGMAICNFNETVSAYRLIYLCGTYNKTTGLFTLRDGGTASSKNYYKLVPTNTANITLSSYFTSGYDYILLGGTYSSNNYIQLFDNNPMFHFDGTNLVPYDSWASGTVKSVNNTSPDANGNVSIAIPTVYNGTLTIQKNGTTVSTFTANQSTNATANITVPTDYASVGAASAAHSHTLSIVASTGTANVTLAFGSSYKLTAGGNDTIFKMPVDVGFANPMTTAGDLIYGGTNGAATRLAKGTNGSVLKMVNGSPAWATDATGTDTWRNIQVSGVDILGTGTNTGALNFIDDIDDDGTNGLIGVGWMYNGGTVSAYASLTDTAITEVLGYTPTSVSTYADVGAASAGHNHTGVYQPAGTYYAGDLSITTTSATNKSLTLSYLYANNVSVSNTLWLSPNDVIVSDTGEADGIHIMQYSATGRYLSIDYNNVNVFGNTTIYGTLYASRASFNGNGQTYISNSYISIYASSYNSTTNYSAILLSAAAAYARISMYASNIYTSATRGMNLYVTSGTLDVTAASGSLNITSPKSKILISASSSYANMDYGVRLSGYTYSYTYGWAATANGTASMVVSNAISVPAGCTAYITAWGWEKSQHGTIAICFSTSTTTLTTAYSDAGPNNCIARADGETGYWAKQILAVTAAYANTTGYLRYAMIGTRYMSNIYVTYHIVKGV